MDASGHHFVAGLLRSREDEPCREHENRNVVDGLLREREDEPFETKAFRG